MSAADRLWLAWKVVTGRVVRWNADVNGFRVTFDFTAAERTAAARREERARRRGHPWTPPPR